MAKKERIASSGLGVAYPLENVGKKGKSKGKAESSHGVGVGMQKQKSRIPKMTTEKKKR